MKKAHFKKGQLIALIDIIDNTNYEVFDRNDKSTEIDSVNLTSEEYNEISKNKKKVTLDDNKKIKFLQ